MGKRLQFCKMMWWFFAPLHPMKDDEIGHLRCMKSKKIWTVIGNFRVALNLIMKARLSAKLFICELVLFDYE